MSTTPITPPSSSPTATTPSPAQRARGTRPKANEANVLLDAGTVLLAVKKHSRTLIAADAGKKVKRITPAWIANFAALAKRGAKARGGQRTLAVQAAATTTLEISARDALYAAATLIRDDVATSFPTPADDGLRRAFGVGARTKTGTTSSVLAFADTLVAAHADDDWNTQAVAAGITPEKITALQSLRDTLASFDTQQKAELNQRAAGTQSKNATIAQLSKLTAYARKVAGVVLRGNATALRDFARTTVRRTPTPRGLAKKATAKPKKRARVAPPRGSRKKKKRG